MEYLEPRRVELTADDRVRVDRLQEEIRSRLDEMAMIVARTIGFELTSDMPRVFVPRQFPAAASDSPGNGIPGETIEIVRLPVNPPMSACVYYIDGVLVGTSVPCEAAFVPDHP